MKKFLPLLVVLLIIPLSVKAVSITSSPLTGITRVEKPITYHITVTNDKGDPDRFILTVFGPHLEWANLQRYYFHLEPHESREISLNFYPDEEGDYKYEVKVSSRENPENEDSVFITLKVNPLIDPNIEDFSVDLVGNELRVNLKVTSRKAREMGIDFRIKDSEKKEVKVLSVTREVEGEREISETIPVGDLLSGSYSIEVMLIDSGVSRKANFYIPPIHNVVTSKKVVSNPLMKEVTITIRNEGNVVDDYSLEENLPANQYVTPLHNPTFQYLESGNVVFEWKFTGLQVGEAIEIKYRVEYWKNLLGWVIMTSAILGLIGLGVTKIRRPNIRKKYIRKKDGHLIVLEVNGSLTRELRNVLVKDRVSPLGKVIPEFEGPKPIVRESEVGTELIWRLGNLKPRSEIYLTYKIRPLIEAQLKMPRAYLTYRTDDRKVRVFSKQIVLE